MSRTLDSLIDILIHFPSHIVVIFNLNTRNIDVHTRAKIRGHQPPFIDAIK